MAPILSPRVTGTDTGWVRLQLARGTSLAAGIRNVCVPEITVAALLCRNRSRALCAGGAKSNRSSFTVSLPRSVCSCPSCLDISLLKICKSERNW